MNEYRLIWQSDLSKKVQIERYMSLVVAHAVSGMHMFPLSITDLEHLEFQHVRSLRRILGIKAVFISRVSNVDVLYKAKCKPLCFSLFMKQCAHLGHILRRPADHPDRRILFASPAQDTRYPQNTAKRVGRPRSKWFDQLYKFVFHPDGIAKNELLFLAKDRAGWFSLTSRLCSNASMIIVQKKNRAASQVPALGYPAEQNVPAIPLVGL